MLRNKTQYTRAFLFADRRLGEASGLLSEQSLGYLWMGINYYL